MKQLILTLLFLSQTFCFQPGLKLPQWYQWELNYKTTPEFKKPFIVEFTFRSTYAPLKDIDVNLTLPDGITLLEGKHSFALNEIKTAQEIKKTFLLKSDKEITGLSFQLNLSLLFPKKEIITEVQSLYGTQEKHQLKQLINKIKTMSKNSNLHFQKPLYILKTEGFKEVPPIIFSSTHQENSHLSPFILFSLNNKLNAKKTLNKITQFEENLNHLMADAQAFEAYKTSYPTEYENMLHENYYDYYQLSFLKLKNKKFNDADQWLQKLTSILLTSENIDYDFFLAIQNLRSLCNLKNQKKSTKILSSAIRTASSSKVRHYLMYNLAVIYEKSENKQQMKHYLSQALIINPSFTLAKDMQSKHKSF
ncbi:MAG: hypothetical protein COB02_03300 [Candidatus Cloacimonadota bacterium]|nr:MAG: hypothetical protein COB02_03300 [Candidatus Cloacimonadota bacterium]